MSKNSIKTLIFLIKTKGQECPPFHFNPTNEIRLLKIAKRNKATPILFHFLKCPVCQKKLNQKTLTELKCLEKQNLISHLIYQNRKKILNQIFLKNKIGAVFIKDFSFYSQMKLHQQFFWGTDLDITIRKNDFKKAKRLLLKKNYLITKSLNYEVTFIKPKMPIEIDLHFLISETKQNELEFLNEKRIYQFSQELLGKSHLDQQGYYLPPKEYFLLSLIWHYSTNDVLRGLRNLNDIIEFTNHYGEEINWKKFLNLAKRFKLKNLSLFVISLGSQIFSLPFPSGLKKTIKIPLKVRWLLPYFSPKKVALFPKGQFWNKSKKGKKLLREHFFLQLIISENIPFYRLIRPKIIIFLFQLYIFHFTKKVVFNKKTK